MTTAFGCTLRSLPLLFLCVWLEAYELHVDPTGVSVDGRRVALEDLRVDEGLTVVRLHTGADKALAYQVLHRVTEANHYPDIRQQDGDQDTDLPDELQAYASIHVTLGRELANQSAAESTVDFQGWLDL